MCVCEVGSLDSMTGNGPHLTGSLVGYQGVGVSRGPLVGRGRALQCKTTAVVKQGCQPRNREWRGCQVLGRQCGPLPLFSRGLDAVAHPQDFCSFSPLELESSLSILTSLLEPCSQGFADSLRIGMGSRGVVNYWKCCVDSYMC